MAVAPISSIGAAHSVFIESKTAKSNRIYATKCHILIAMSRHTDTNITLGTLMYSTSNPTKIEYLRTLRAILWVAALTSSVRTISSLLRGVRCVSEYARCPKTPSSGQSFPAS